MIQDPVVEQLRASAAMGITPDVALRRILGNRPLVPPVARSLGFGQSIDQMKRVLEFFATEEGATWLRQGDNLERLLVTLAALIG